MKVVRRGDVGRLGERQFCAHKRGKMERRRGREGDGGKGEEGRGMEGKKKRKVGRWRERRRGKEGDGGKEEEEGTGMDVWVFRGVEREQAWMRGMKGVDGETRGGGWDGMDA